MKRGKFLDLVITGPDMSGTSTQIKNTIEFFQGKNLKVKDLRGTEIDLLFHSKIFQDELERINHGTNFLNLQDYFSAIKRGRESGSTTSHHLDILFHMYELLSGRGTNQDLRVGSMVENSVTTYIDPNSADVYIMEEPTKRGAGQGNRVLEQNRSKFGDKMNPKAAAESHSIYRSNEFFLLRKVLREFNKIIVRSRSEDSACYQRFHWRYLRNGVSRKYYSQLEGHKVAFANPPTNIFAVCGPENWKVKDYLDLKKQRSDERDIDDHEADANYQVLVNKRYSTKWLEKLYRQECKKYGVNVPEITRFSIYDSKEEIKEKMQNKLETLF